MSIDRTYDYVVELKAANNTQAYDWISQLLLFISIAAIGYSAITAIDYETLVVPVIFCVLIAGKWLHSRISDAPFRWALLMAAVGWAWVLHQFWIAALMILAAVLEKQIKFKQEIGFDEEGVAFNSFPKKTYQWHEVNNVVLKDGIITVDLYNNRIIQKEIESDIPKALEKEFNEFCRSHLFSFQS